jgi:hypothetical protein
MGMKAEIPKDITDFGTEEIHAPAAAERDLGAEGGVDRSHGQVGEESGAVPGSENGPEKTGLATEADSEEARAAAGR